MESKRQRTDGALRPRKKAKIQSAARRTKHGHPIDVDQLAWREIEVPERLEDAEGFLGLEEIDDVDIRRNEEDGTIEYLQGQEDQTIG